MLCSQNINMEMSLCEGGGPGILLIINLEFFTHNA